MTENKKESDPLELSENDQDYLSAITKVEME